MLISKPMTDTLSCMPRSYLSQHLYSGWEESDQSVYVPYSGEPLKSRQSVKWKVRYRDENGAESDWSDWASIEMGLLSKTDWQARWIRPDLSGDDFEIIKAHFHSIQNPEKGADLTELLKSKIKDGRLLTKTGTGAMGGNPAKGEDKQLVVDYRYKGETRQAIFPERVDILLPPEANYNERVATLKREFTSSNLVSKARLYVTARGIFDVHLNGKRVGEDVFANGWTPYRTSIDTLTYDVTDMIQDGDNDIRARLAAGWHAGRISWRHDGSWLNEQPEFLMQLEITHDDGSVEYVVTDKDWQATFEGPIVNATYYDGETYDARIEADNWQPVHAGEDLGDIKLAPKPFQSVRPIEQLEVQELTEPESGRFVFDLGQNMVGWPMLNMPVVKDQTITIRFAEMLNQDGSLYTENYRSAKSTDTYTSATTGTVEWQPSFTFHGFRYVELSGFPEGVKPEKDWVKGVVLHTDMLRKGSFVSSHDKLNQLQSNIRWGQKGNFLDIPTDCPQRDERLGWTGDAQVFAATAMFNYDCHAFFKSWLGSMREDQHQDGRVPNIIPNVLGNNASPGWQDAATIIPWEVYVSTGDRSVLEENYEMMSKLVNWYRTHTDKGIGFKDFAFGDWLQPYAKDRKGETPKHLIGAAFYAKSLQILADTAEVLGKEEATALAEELKEVKQAFAAHYLGEDGKLKHGADTQTGYLLALEFDLVPVELHDKAASRLVELVKTADGHLRTGFLGTPYIAPVLDRTGHPDVAFDVLFKETYPSWFYSINQGATTMWERWNSYSHKDGFGDASMNSFNHYAYGAIGQWLYERVAGLSPDPDQPGYKHIIIQPLVGGPLTSARAEVETPYGQAVSAWKLEEGQFKLEVVVPPNTTATVFLPVVEGEGEKVESGSHSFDCKWPL